MRKRRKKRHGGMVWMLVVLIFLLGIMWYHTSNLKEKQQDGEQRLNELERQVASESRRAEELEQESKLRQTLKYIEKVAREKLGLVFPDEIIVEPE